MEITFAVCLHYGENPMFWIQLPLIYFVWDSYYSSKSQVQIWQHKEKLIYIQIQNPNPIYWANTFHLTKDKVLFQK